MSDALVLRCARRDAKPAIRAARSASGIAVALRSSWCSSAGRRWCRSMPVSMPPGTIAVAGNRQSVQHRDGGVVTAIHVREGQHVRAGEVLVELSAPELRASERALTSDYLTLLAQRARLLAERTGQRDFAPPAEFASLQPEDRELAAAGAGAAALGDAGARSGPMSAQQSVLGQRAGQLRAAAGAATSSSGVADRAAAADRSRSSTA